MFLPEQPLSPLGLALPPELLREALTHASYANEDGQPSNERMEVLGDATLSFAIT
ncbi:MAG: ribonuclease III domain-containing protein, partial [Candidatus Bipolaricaulaceae bacterium]